MAQTLGTRRALDGVAHIKRTTPRLTSVPDHGASVPASPPVVRHDSPAESIPPATSPQEEWSLWLWWTDLPQAARWIALGFATWVAIAIGGLLTTFLGRG